MAETESPNMNSEKTLPSECEATLVISCGKISSEEVILNIIGVESPPECLAEQNQNVKGFPWTFETKYYTAEMNLLALKEKTELDADFCSSIRAVVFYFDSLEESSFEEVQSWMPILKDIEAEVQLMVCNNAADESGNLAEVRKKFLNWCVKNQYELIELNPSPDSDDEDSTVKSAKGYERVIEALQSHQWANLVMKNEIDLQESLKENLKINEEIVSESQESDASSPKVENIENTASATAEGTKKVAVEGEELQLEEQWLNSVLSGEDTEGESMEALFGKFASMKERANGLSGEERKKYAEKVAIAFWKAMGGDEDEIDGLDDLED